MLSMAIGFACITAPVGECAGSPLKVEKSIILKSNTISVSDIKFEASYNLEVKKESPGKESYPINYKIDNVCEIVSFNYGIIKSPHTMTLYKHYNSKGLNCKISKRYISPHFLYIKGVS
jgi:hypothetical protein